MLGLAWLREAHSATAMHLVEMCSSADQDVDSGGLAGVGVHAGDR
jgi:hypothetical protein